MVRDPGLSKKEKEVSVCHCSLTVGPVSSVTSCCGRCDSSVTMDCTQNVSPEEPLPQAAFVWALVPAMRRAAIHLPFPENVDVVSQLEERAVRLLSTLSAKTQVSGVRAKPRFCTCEKASGPGRRRPYNWSCDHPSTLGPFA